MPSFRLPKPIEHELNQFCAYNNLSRSHVVQAALSAYMASNPIASPAKQLREPDRSFLSLADPIRQFIGIANTGTSTDEWMAIIRGESSKKTLT
jgi:hypothetical protein